MKSFKKLQLLEPPICSYFSKLFLSIKIILFIYFHSLYPTTTIDNRINSRFKREHDISTAIHSFLFFSSRLLWKTHSPILYNTHKILNSPFSIHNSHFRTKHILSHHKRHTLQSINLNLIDSEEIPFQRSSSIDKQTTSLSRWILIPFCSWTVDPTTLLLVALTADRNIIAKSKERTIAGMVESCLWRTQTRQFHWLHIKRIL